MLDPNLLADEIVKRMKEEHHTLWLDPETHAVQHEFLQLLMSEREERIKRRKALEDKIAGSVLLSLIMGMVALIGAGALDWLRAHIK